MSFKDNLLKKIEIDQLAHRVIQSLKLPDSGGKFDKASMQKILAMGEYPTRQERDMDLYILENTAEKKKILVLDNGLAIYHTTIKDVCMRKSPSVKEMISIRNTIKILNDKDVLLSKKEASVRTVQADVTKGLDLAYTEADIEQIEKEGQASLESRYADGVLEALSLFAELLDYREAPKAFQVTHHKILGSLQTKENNETVFGPIVTYSMAQNTLKLIDTPIGSFDKEKMAFFRQVIDDRADAAMEGLPVFKYLKTSVPEYQPQHR